MRKKRYSKTNAEEGGRAEFWDNDIDSELDDAWAFKVALDNGVLFTQKQIDRMKKESKK